MQSTEGTTRPAIGEPAEWAPRLSKILADQREVCLQLEQLSGRQGEQIRSGDTEALMQVLGERQELINRLGELNTEIEPYRREWAGFMGRLAAPERARMEAATLELRELVDRIWARDEEDRLALETQRSAVSSELTNLSRGRVALSAYGVRPEGAGPMYQDRSC